MYFCVKFLKRSRTYFDTLLEFSKTSQKYWRKNICYIFLFGWLFRKTNTINCDDNDDAMFPNTRVFAFTRQPMKQNFTWSTRATHLRSSSTFLCRLKFWFSKKLKMNLRIALTDTSFCKCRDHAKALIVFKRWCNCLILCEIVLQLEILRENSWFFQTYANSNKMSGPLHVPIKRSILY